MLRRRGQCRSAEPRTTGCTSEHRDRDRRRLGGVQRRRGVVCRARSLLHYPAGGSVHQRAKPDRQVQAHLSRPCTGVRCESGECAAMNTLLTDMTRDDRRSLFPSFVYVPVEVRHRGDYVPATLETLCGPGSAVVLLPGSAMLVPLTDVRVTHETLHAREKVAPIRFGAVTAVRVDGRTFVAHVIERDGTKRFMALPAGAGAVAVVLTDSGEGVRWIRGCHMSESPEAAALVAAYRAEVSR